jgi:hypothetical protein
MHEHRYICECSRRGRRDIGERRRLMKLSNDNGDAEGEENRK